MTDETTQAGENRIGWDSTAVRLANHLARQNFPRGDLAALRRMSPAAADTPAFWRLAAQYDLLGGTRLERKWALIVHGIALMTPTVGGKSAHDPQRSVGAALYRGSDVGGATALYSETRFNRLLTARGTMLHTLLIRMFRMLASAGVSFDWREMARFILNDGYNESRAEQARRRIARSYYREEHRQASPTTS